MQKWQYLVVFIEDSRAAQDQPEFDVYLDADRFTEKLNIYGEAGWELVNLAWEENGAKTAFKRLPPPPPVDEEQEGKE